MKIKEISVQWSKTVNTGNYNSEKIGASETVILEEGDVLQDVYDQAFTMVKSQINKQFQILKDRM